MRTVHQAISAVETYSPAEELFNRRRRTAGLFLAPRRADRRCCRCRSPASPRTAHRMAAIMLMVVVLWVTEALPMAVTAVLGPVLAVVFGSRRPARRSRRSPIRSSSCSSAAFMLAQAMFVHGVDRRIAYTALSWRFVGTSARAHPGGLRRGRDRPLDVDQQHRDHRDDVSDRPVDRRAPGPHGIAAPATVRRFAMAMMLITSFGASIGGMATPVGTPPNLIGIGMLEKIAGRPRSRSSSGWRSASRSSIVLFAYLLAAVLLHVGPRA